MTDDVIIVSGENVTLLTATDTDAVSSDAAVADLSGNYSLQLATNTDAAIYNTTVNQHLYNIELLLVILVTFVVCFVVHVMFRGLFSKLSGKG
jgi:beta-lactamase regulating signal transducer with metallopeptidase domain